MGCLYALIVLINVALLIVADVFMWMHSALIGFFGILGIIGFGIGCALAPHISIAPRDHWTNSEFDVFMKVLIAGNTCALVVWGGLVILASMLGNETAMSFVDWASN